jgi:succinate dehydrogenase hydrophobic anchor subunit
MYDVRFVSQILTGAVLHGYLTLFLFYLMTVNGSDNIDWVGRLSE